jgi:hypothetical protein
MRRLLEPHASAAIILGDELNAGGFERCLNAMRRRPARRSLTRFKPSNGRWCDFGFERKTLRGPA